jgi:hypothetical protein
VRDRLSQSLPASHSPSFFATIALNALPSPDSSIWALR